MNEPRSEPPSSLSSPIPPAIDLWQHIARERRQIGYDLHDGLLQQIIGAGMLLEALRYRIVGGHITTEKDILNIAQILDNAIHEGRILIRQLEQNELAECESFEVSLKRWLATLEKQTNKIRFHMHIEPSVSTALHSLPPATTGHLLAIAREATSNILKHSKASEAHIELHYQTHPSTANPQSPSERRPEARLTIRDNGRGMAIGELWDEDQKNHFGLSSMQHRAESIRGQLSLQSEPGQGTTVQLVFPL